MVNITFESSNFTLRTFDILPQNQILNNTDNNIGSIFGNGAYLLWKNVNLMDIIGSDMWNKYDNFNLNLKTYGFRPTTPNASGPVPPAQNPARIASIWISGFSFSNGKNQNGIAIEQAGNSNTDAGIFISSNLISFNKLRPIVDIVLELKTSHNSIVNDFNEKPAYMYGHHTFLFNIFPVKK